MLYKRDFRKLTEKENNEMIAAENYMDKYRKTEFTVDALYKYHEMLPTASYHFKSLFPNNYLHIDLLRETEKLNKIQKEFIKILNSDYTERKILNFINKDENFNLIASLFQAYSFGHHEAFLFKEFELTSTFRADYLLVGKSSGGYHFIFIELEPPYGQITQKNGEFGTILRKGLKQVEDWNSWIEGNFSTLKLIFEKYQGSYSLLPKEFLTLDKSRLNYVVIAGRRKDFSEKTYELKRKYLKRNNTLILHYDNLLDLFESLKTSKNY